MDPQTIALIGALGAVGAGIGSWLSARASKNAAQMQPYHDVLREYGSDQMLADLRRLRAWKKSRGQDFMIEFRDGLEEDDTHIQKVDGARRRVFHFFARILKLYDARLINRDRAEDLLSVEAVHLFMEIVEPLEYALNPEASYLSPALLK